MWHLERTIPMGGIIRNMFLSEKQDTVLAFLTSPPSVKAVSFSTGAVKWQGRRPLYCPRDCSNFGSYPYLMCICPGEDDFLFLNTLPVFETGSHRVMQARIVDSNFVRVVTLLPSLQYHPTCMDCKDNMLLLGVPYPGTIYIYDFDTGLASRTIQQPSFYGISAARILHDFRVVLTAKRVLDMGNSFVKFTAISLNGEAIEDTVEIHLDSLLVSGLTEHPVSKSVLVSWSSGVERPIEVQRDRYGYFDGFSRNKMRFLKGAEEVVSSFVYISGARKVVAPVGDRVSVFLDLKDRHNWIEACVRAQRGEEREMGGRKRARNSGVSI